MARFSGIRFGRPDTHAVLVAGGYTLVSLLWIWSSDWLVDGLSGGDQRTVHLLQSSKGSAFVVATGVALYLTLALVNARQKRLAAEKRLMEEMLSVSQRLEALGTLAGTLVHDFNNVLTVIRSQTELARMDDYAPHSLPDHFNAIGEATRRADEMVRELTLFMRREPTLYSLADMGEAVRETVPFLQNAAGRSIEISVEISPLLPKVPFDRTQLERSLLNLVLNARDAMARQSTKRVTLGVQAVQFQQYRSLYRREPANGTYVAVSVADTGCGIPRELHARVFAPFFTTKPSGQGSGLGLTSVLRVAEAHGGWVELASEPGKGARFTLFFPTESIAQQNVLDAFAEHPA